MCLSASRGCIFVLLSIYVLLDQGAIALLLQPLKTTVGAHSSSSFVGRSNNCRQLHSVVSDEETNFLPRNPTTDDVWSELEETKLLVNTQQQQIGTLLDLLESKELIKKEDRLEHFDIAHTLKGQPANFKFETPQTDTSLRPLKVMLFIDGTWLYYSIHEREDEWCPINQRYGKGWQFKYNIDWGSLPRAIGQALQDQDQNRGWNAVMPRKDDESDHTTVRPIEITRVSVYTSFKADTPKTSFRYKMFQDMLAARYDVNMMETVGKGEKCVDIQLGVDMLHYATVPDAYDVALLLSGDKDFLPALSRCRQKGRRVGLVSMRRACNRALFETPGIKDYDVIWLEDLLGELVKPRSQSEMRKRAPNVSVFTLMKIVNDYITRSGMPRVSSRDIGKYIKTVMIGDRCVLDEVKQTYGGLYQFLIVSDIYVVDRIDGVTAFWVGLKENVDSKLAEEAKETQFTDDEKIFFDEYDLNFLDDKEAYYFHTIADSDDVHEAVLESAMPLTGHANDVSLPVELLPDYSTLTVAKLKEVCKDRNLPTSGKKADLIERIEVYLEEEDSKRQKYSEPDELSAEDYLAGLLQEYLQVKGGKASSRDVGRYLQANKASAQRHQNANQRISALSELKELFGGTRRFVMQSDLFYIEEMESDEEYEFRICLKAAE